MLLAIRRRLVRPFCKDLVALNAAIVGSVNRLSTTIVFLHSARDVVVREELSNRRRGRVGIACRDFPEISTANHGKFVMPGPERESRLCLLQGK